MYALTQLAAADQKIIDGTLDKLLRKELYLKSGRKATTKKVKKVNHMATSSVAPNQLTFDEKGVGTPTTVKPEVINPGSEKTDYGFELLKDGVHIARLKSFNLETLEKESQYVPYKVTNLSKAEELAKIPVDEALALVNYAKQVMLENLAKEKIGGGNAIAVNNFVNGFRFMPMFNKPEFKIENNDSAETKSSKRKAQGKAILGFVKKMPELFQQLKEAAATPEDETPEEPEK